jgi:hypothetical protein
VYGNVNETKGEQWYNSNEHQVSIRFHAGVWMSKSPDHDIIVMDIEGFSKKELEQEKVD